MSRDPPALHLGQAASQVSVVDPDQNSVFITYKLKNIIS